MIGGEGSFVRYLFTASINTLIFLILWELFFFVLPENGFWPTFSWGASWILSSFIAHWTHRIMTFNSDRDIRWTIPVSMSVYAFTLIGSMTTYYVATEVFAFSASNQLDLGFIVLQIGIIWIANYAIWGALNYLGQKMVAFKEISIYDPLADVEASVVE